MSTNRRLLLAGAVSLLTPAQAYILYQLLFCAWMTAFHAQDKSLPYWQHWTEFFEVLTVPVGLLWVTCVVMLIRTRPSKQVAKLT